MSMELALTTKGVIIIIAIFVRILALLVRKAQFDVWALLLERHVACGFFLYDAFIFRCVDYYWLDRDLRLAAYCFFLELLNDTMASFFFGRGPRQDRRLRSILIVTIIILTLFLL